MHFSTQAVQAACCEEVKGGAVTDFDLVLYGAGTGHGHGRAAPTLHTTPSPCHVGALTLTPYHSPGSRQQYNGAAQCRRLASFVLFRNTKQYKCITKHRPPVRGCLWASGGSRRGPHCSPAEPTPPPSYPQGENQGGECARAWTKVPCGPLVRSHPNCHESDARERSMASQPQVRLAALPHAHPTRARSPPDLGQPAQPPTRACTGDAGGTKVTPCACVRRALVLDLQVQSRWAALTVAAARMRCPHDRPTL